MINIGNPSFPILSFDQANPGITAMLKSSQMIQNMQGAQAQMIKNRYLAAQLQQALKQAGAQSQMMGAQASVAQPEAQAELAAKQAGIYTSPYPQFLQQTQMLRNGVGLPQGSQVSQSVSSALGAQAPGASISAQGGAVPEAYAKFISTPAQLAQQRAQGSLTAEQNINFLKQANQEGNESTQMNNYLNQYNDAMDKIKYLKGAVDGHLPVGREGNFISNIPSQVLSAKDVANAQIADNASNAIATQFMSSGGLPGNRLTNLELSTFKGGKPDRTLDDDARKQITSLLSAKLKRGQEYPQFAQAYLAKGGNALDAQTAWNRYQQDYPIYDAKKGVVQSNLGNWNKYLPGSKGSLPLSDKQINQLKQVMANEGASSPANSNSMVTVQMPDGKQWTIPGSKLNLALQRGAKQVG
ncbi:MAG: hypothetical protein A3E87_01625 [Gammaproteobacteria bacterium RIFCSPHIGHO2_12_FULL_35_23]|nr:MAG: hypothetical protein A3E87_01625 [Gammaproteobacteria bacterium RIFCSPHIGHO2_12_FULL_35_23]